MLWGACLHHPKFPLVVLLAGAKEVPQTRPAQPLRTHPQKASLGVHRAVAEGHHFVLVAPHHLVPGTCGSRASFSTFPGTIQWEAVANPLAVLLFPSFKDGRRPQQLPHPPPPPAPSLPRDAGEGSEPRSGKMKVILGNNK